MRKRAQGKELPRAHSWEGAPRSDPSAVLHGTSPALLRQQGGTCAPEVPARECERSTCLGVQK